MCQTRPTGNYTRWDFDSETIRFIPRHNETRSFENMVMSCFQRTRPECEIESFFTTSRLKKMDCFSVDGFCSHCNTVFEAMGCFYHFCPCQELRLSLTEEDIQRGSKKRELDALRRHYIQEKVSLLLKSGSANGGGCTKHPILLNNISETTTPSLQTFTCSWANFRRDKGKKVIWLSAVRFWSTWKFRSQIVNFPPILKNPLLSKSDIGHLMKNYAEEERLLSQPRKMLISSFTLQNGTLVTPLLSFYLQLDLVCTKMHRFVEYTPKKCFHSFAQTAVGARGQGDENPNSSVVSETLKLLANSSYGYQITERSQHTGKKYLIDKKNTCSL